MSLILLALLFPTDRLNGSDKEKEPCLTRFLITQLTDRARAITEFRTIPCHHLSNTMSTQTTTSSTIKKPPYGHFSTDAQRYIITERELPRHWYNYLWNDNYITFTSQVGYGEGFAQDDMGRRATVVLNRMVHLLDSNSGEHWSANALPIDQAYTGYECVHGIGYTSISLTYAGIETRLRLFVPRDDSGEIWSLRIRNTRDRACKLKAMPYVKTAIDSLYRPQGYDMGAADFDAELQAVVSRTYQAFGSAEQQQVFTYLMSSSTVSGYDGRNDAFVGAYGNDQRPKAIQRGGCSNSSSYAEKICFALEQSVVLAAGERCELHFMVGFATTVEQIKDVRARLLADSGKVEAEFKSTCSKLADDISGIRIETPDTGLNNLFNGFLKHQTSLGSRWARVRHNGFRDTNCDCECLGIFNPQLAWERTKRIISYQYSSGYAPRTFLDGAVLDRGGYMDNTVWITFNVYHLLKEIGDLSILDDVVAFNDGSAASVYEHLKRSVDFLWDSRGELGLVKIGGGDWNDCLNEVGLKGRGMSVWLSMAWYLANKQFAEIATLKGHPEDAELAHRRGEQMKSIVNDVAWDGEHYLVAYTDNMDKLGSMENDEGKMHIMPQIWAVMADIGMDGKEVRAMNAVERHMMTDLGVRMAWPPYSYSRSDIGDTTRKLPGVHENGGVYIHAYTWKTAADCMLKRNLTVQQNLEKMLPDNHKWVKKHCEPYIMCNSYFPEETGYRYASAGQTWRTGSGAWFLKDVAFYILGLQPEMQGLRLNPCLPPDWKQCSVEKDFRGARYQILYTNEATSDGAEIRTITVNGMPHTSDILPWQEGAEFKVEVHLR